MPESLADRVHGAADRNDVSSLRSLLAEHPDAIEIENDDGEAPLVAAAVEGSTAAVKLLLELGADPCRQKAFALTCACYWGHVDVVEALLEGGGDVAVREVRRWHGLHTACGWGRHPKVEIVQMLLDAGANPKRIFEGRTPLQYAKEKGQSEIVALLQKHREPRS